ncbi:hypothetical protein C7E13_21730 [Stenotrophomonas maltophilia]|nr:hypothetical protein C7E13_21730 [Stenotrophomonas maltophilia]
MMPHRFFSCDRRVTTDDLKSEGQTSVSSRSARPLLLGLALCLTSLPAWSQTAPNRSDVPPAPVAESAARPAPSRHWWKRVCASQPTRTS